MSDESEYPEPEQPVVDPRTPLFTEDRYGRVAVEWPADIDGPVLVTREALQMLVDRANGRTQR